MLRYFIFSMALLGAVSWGAPLPAPLTSPKSTSPGGTCADFSGSWKGSCSDSSGEQADAIETIFQSSCSQIAFIGLPWLTPGAPATTVTNTAVDPAGDLGTLTLSAHWNDAQTSLAVDYAASTQSQDGSLTTVSSRETYSREGQTLLVQIHSLEGPELDWDCRFNKQN